VISTVLAISAMGPTDPRDEFDTVVVERVCGFVESLTIVVTAVGERIDRLEGHERRCAQVVFAVEHLLVGRVESNRKSDSMQVCDRSTRRSASFESEN
jgi:hypothetical protein